MTGRLPVLVLILAGCGRVPCGDVGRAIAHRTLSCERSSDMALGRARALQFTATCPADGWWDPGGISSSCVKAIDALDCATVHQNGDDLSAWLSASPSCDALTLGGSGGGGSGGDGGGGTGGDSGQDTADTGDTGDVPEELPCSEAAGEALSLSVTNDSDTAVDIFWRDESCEEVIVTTLARTASTPINTYVGHAFVARELTGSRDAVDWVVATDAPSQTWSIQRRQ